MSKKGSRQNWKKFDILENTKVNINQPTRRRGSNSKRFGILVPYLQCPFVVFKCSGASDSLSSSLSLSLSVITLAGTLLTRNAISTIYSEPLGFRYIYIYTDSISINIMKCIDKSWRLKTRKVEEVIMEEKEKFVPEAVLVICRNLLGKRPQRHERRVAGGEPK